MGGKTAFEICWWGCEQRKGMYWGGYSDFLLHENGRRIKLPRFWPEMAWNITKTNLLVSNNVRYDVQEKVFDTVPLYILLAHVQSRKLGI